MEFCIGNGVWPTMVTIFNKDGSLDLAANRELARYLVEMGSDGIFGVCQSSEMFFLSIEERVSLARATKQGINGQAHLVISGHTAENLSDQISELKQLEEINPDALVLVTNRLAGLHDGADVFKRNTTAILDAMPNCAFGFYECPHPFKRLLSDDELRWCADTGRIGFLKDVSCDTGIQAQRAKIVSRSGLKLYNANTETLLSSLRVGYNGYNGIMGNFHIDIYKWLYDNTGSPEAENVQAWLTRNAMIEAHTYPIVAKYFLQLKGYDFPLYSRVKNQSEFTDADRAFAEKMLEEEKELRSHLGLPQRPGTARQAETHSPAV